MKVVKTGSSAIKNSPIKNIDSRTSKHRQRAHLELGIEPKSHNVRQWDASPVQIILMNYCLNEIQIAVEFRFSAGLKKLSYLNCKVQSVYSVRCSLWTNSLCIPFRQRCVKMGNGQEDYWFEATLGRLDREVSWRLASLVSRLALALAEAEVVGVGTVSLHQAKRSRVSRASFYLIMGGFCCCCCRSPLTKSPLALCSACCGAMWCVGTCGGSALAQPMTWFCLQGRGWFWSDEVPRCEWLHINNSDEQLYANALNTNPLKLWNSDEQCAAWFVVYCKVGLCNIMLR